MVPREQTNVPTKIHAEPDPARTVSDRIFEAPPLRSSGTVVHRYAGSRDAGQEAAKTFVVGS